MNFDERLERIAERHEALAQSVELLALENRQLAGNIGKLDILVREITGGIRDLMTIAQSHERRISGLEHP